MIKGKLLVANRGEIAVRVLRTAAELGLPTVAVHPDDDTGSLHTSKADEARLLPGRGAAAYLDGAAIVAAAKATGATTIHPGYGFLSESADFAQSCVAEGITFVGPRPETLALFGDKHAARALAAEHNIPTLPGTNAPTSLADAHAFLESLGSNGAVMVKAVAGGGGRGMRPVHGADRLEEAFIRCQSEAQSSFGNGHLYVEQLVRNARHIEVQVIGDGAEVSHLWERDCSIQRRRQKIVEIAPAPNLLPALRDQLIESSLRLAGAASYLNLGTFEYLVDTDSGAFFFIEANPRLQVEHTVTEEITGLDLVELQLRLASGQSLAALGLARHQIPLPRGMAMQLRVNTETMTGDGEVKPGGGTLTAYEPPCGRGIRVDGYGYAGYRTNPAYDSLLAKVVVHHGSNDLSDLMAKGYRALCEFNVAGAPTNLAFLQALVSHEAVKTGSVNTTFVEAHADDLIATDNHPQFYFSPTHTAATPEKPRERGITQSGVTGAGARVDHRDPLAVLAYGQAATSAAVVSGGGSQGSSNTTGTETTLAVDASAEIELSDGMVAIRAPMQGTIVSVAVSCGDLVATGAELVVMEAMKMEHVLSADVGGTVADVYVAAGDTLWEDQIIVTLVPGNKIIDRVVEQREVDLDEIRPDLAEVLARRSLTLDESRPTSVERRRKTGQRTVRENVSDLIDPGTFIEYGPLVVAAQRQRRKLDDLMTRSPADGLITGVGRINGNLFDDPLSRAAVMAYDYTVFAGTQGVHNHWKTDRLIDVAEQGRMPLVLFGEGGGGRPGDTDYGGFVGQNTFHHFGQLSGLVPMIGIVSGRCFAGNAALLGACDVIIATANTNLGMGGPAMVEGGGLGVFRPEDIGPMSVQVPNGVVDIPVEDEAEAVAVAKRYLTYFQGRVTEWTAPDQRQMRAIVPENRLRVYEVRDVINTLADNDSVLELRKAFGRTMITAFIRVEGRPVGVMANDPAHVGGAIDSDGADKGARFMQLCDAFDIPILNLCDTPGIMVGPEVEKTALVRHAARLFLVGSNVSVPYFTVVLRKAYGLGAIGMAGGNFRAPYFTVSWPTGEFGPMGLEGQVKLGFRAELEAIDNPDERAAYFEKMVAQSYEDGKALARSTSFGIDDTIDPSETRHWLAGLLNSIRPPAPRNGKKRAMIDAW
jgi:acetyl/propionyl-CoA carboxylase alpha subunit/acetyl-CoA carboxylase carboxyltransferase component